jgi:DNA-binding NarL/FixJ family response regulator
VQSSNPKTSVIICDDHPIFRQGLIRIIERDESLKLIGECGDGNAAFELIKNQKPKIAILDITMPGKTGLSVAHLVKKEQLPTKIIILTMHTDEEYLNEAIGLGVQGYLLKENAVTDLAICIHKVASGNYFVSPLLEEILMSYTKKSLSESNYLLELEKLTEIERKILKLIAYNKTSSDILKELSLIPETFQKYREKIIEKLDLYGPYKLYEFAIQHRDSL